MEAYSWLHSHVQVILYQCIFHGGSYHLHYYTDICLHHKNAKYIHLHHDTPLQHLGMRALNGYISILVVIKIFYSALITVLLSNSIILCTCRA